MKKLLIVLSFILILTSCSTTETIVVDQSGKVIERKGFEGFVGIGRLPIDNAPDGFMYEDTRTGCKYGQLDGKIFPYYNVNGQVDGCKNVKVGG